MGKSLERVLQSDGSYKWEMTDFQPETTETTTEATSPPKKKASKKKSTSALSE